MDKQLVEMRTRIFFGNVTLSVFLLLARAPCPCPAAGRPALVTFYSNCFAANAKSPRHEVRRASKNFGRSYFFCVFTVLPETLSFTSTSFFFSSRLVSGSVCFGVLTGVLAMMGRNNW